MHTIFHFGFLFEKFVITYCETFLVYFGSAFCIIIYKPFIWYYLVQVNV